MYLGILYKCYYFRIKIMELVHLVDFYLGFFYLAVNKLLDNMQNTFYFMAEHSGFIKYTFKNNLIELSKLMV